MRRFCCFVAALAAVLPPVPSAPAKQDVALFQKAAGPIERGRFLQSTSDITLTGAGQAMSVTVREHVQFVRARPGRFRSEVTLLTPTGKRDAVFLIVSDGAKVWTLDPAAGQYAVVPLTQYAQSYNLGRHIAGLGLFGALAAGSDPPQGDLLRDMAKTLAGGQMGASGGVATVGGAHLTTLTLADGDHFKIRFLLDPRAATFRRLEFAGQLPSLRFTMAETVACQSFPPEPDARLFQFTPPPGVIRVESVRIGFFP